MGEVKLEEGKIEYLLRKDLKLESSHPIFIPATTYTKNHRSITIHLLEGYIFVASGLSEMEYFNIEKKPYISKVLSSPSPNGMRVLSVIPNAEIVEMRRQLRSLSCSDVEAGYRVTVVEGLYAPLEGEVLEVLEEYAIVYFEFRSLEIITSIPLVFLEIV